MAGPPAVIGSGIGALVARAMPGVEGDKAIALRREAVHGGCIRVEEIRLARTANPLANRNVSSMNLVGGVPYGAARAIGPSVLSRPFKRSADGETPRKRLVLIGALAHPGRGLGGGWGICAAKELGA